MRIYTSYYSRLRDIRAAGILPIAVSRGIPHWAGIDPKRHAIFALAPRRDMLHLPWEEYKPEYAAILARLDAELMLKAIRITAEDKDCALLCWEKDHNTCHRSLVAKWLNCAQHAGISEWEPSANVQGELLG